MNKNDFPIFKNNPQLVYLDSTATSLKPKVVIDKLRDYYESYSANIFRGVYKISEKATEEYEQTREVVADFINGQTDEIIFTRNTTESINLLTYSLGDYINEKDEIVTTIMEHHSNFVPWQQLALKKKAIFKVIGINKNYLLDINDKNIEKIITKRTKILALTYISNVLGTVNPVEEIIKKARKINSKIIVIIDAAQATAHLKVDVKKINSDFLAFSAHKMLGPTGLGVLWGKKERLITLKPFNFGGEMISQVFIERTFFKDPPYRFEAGTPAIAEAIAFKEAIKYLKKIGIKKIENHEKKLAIDCFKTLKQEFKEKIRIFGPNKFDSRGAIIAFSFKNYHPHDIASILDEKNIAVRAGYHCAMPLHQRLKVNGTVRASFYLYNTKKDIEKLVTGLRLVEKKLK